MTPSQKSLEYKVEKLITEKKLISSGDYIIVAVSGGPDSVALLYLLNKLKEKSGIKLSACHYNHKIRGEESERDEQFVKKICQEWGIECFFGSAPSDKPKFKNEEQARQGRYGFFEKILSANRGAQIAIAHNADDLLETFILQFVRGSGLRGLRSIPLCRKKLLRPLLYAQKKEILAYLERENVPFVTDSTNQDLSLSRNYLRHKVLPLLIKLNPNLHETGILAIQGIETDYDFLEKEIEKNYKIILDEESVDRIIFDRQKWSLLHPALQTGVLRLAIEKLGTLTDVTAKQILEVVNIINKGAGKKHKILPRSLRIELISGKIYICRSIQQGDR